MKILILFLLAFGAQAQPEFKPTRENLCYGKIWDGTHNELQDFEWGRLIWFCQNGGLGTIRCYDNARALKWDKDFSFTLCGHQRSPTKPIRCVQFATNVQGADWGTALGFCSAGGVQAKELRRHDKEIDDLRDDVNRLD